MKNYNYLEKALEHNPNNSIFENKQEYPEPAVSKVPESLFLDLINKVKKRFTSTDIQQENTNITDNIKEEFAIQDEMNPKEELCKKVNFFSNLLYLTDDYCTTGTIPDKRKKPNDLISAWKYALKDERCPALWKEFKNIEATVQIICSDSTLEEKRILVRWYAYLCYLGLERIYSTDELICLTDEIRHKFTNSNEFKNDTICIVGKTPWYCDNTLLIKGLLEYKSEEISEESAL